MIVEHVSIVEMVKDKRGEHKYIYNVFDCDNTNYSIFFTYHKYLFNVNPDYPKIRIIPTLIRKMVDIEMICDK